MLCKFIFNCCKRFNKMLTRLKLCNEQLSLLKTSHLQKNMKFYFGKQKGLEKRNNNDYVILSYNIIFAFYSASSFLIFLYSF